MSRSFSSWIGFWRKPCRRLLLGAILKVPYHHPVSPSRIIIPYHHPVSSSRITIPYHHPVSNPYTACTSHLSRRCSLYVPCSTSSYSCTVHTHSASLPCVHSEVLSREYGPTNKYFAKSTRYTPAASPNTMMMRNMRYDDSEYGIR